MSSVIVIGGGAIGASLTYRLCAAGAGVTLLDAGTPGGGTTSATFAMSIATRKTPHAHYRLAASGMAEHNRLVAELGLTDATSWVHPAPAYEWPTTEHDRELIGSRVARLREWGHASEWTTGAGLRAAEPGLRGPAPDEPVAVYPDEHWYDPDLMTRLLLDEATRLGADVHAGARVTAIAETADGVEVRTGDTVHRADRVALCAGPRTAEVARLAGLEVPVRQVPGLVVRTAPVPAGTLRGIVLLPDVNVRPAPGGRLLAHSYTTEADLPCTLDDPARSTWAQRVHDHAAAVVPAFGEAGIGSARLGIRPVPADGMPIVGRLGGSRVYAVAAHSGINFAPVLGRLAALELLGDDAGDALAAFRPTRESLVTGASLDESTREMGRILDDGAGDAALTG